MKRFTRMLLVILSCGAVFAFGQNTERKGKDPGAQRGVPASQSSAAPPSAVERCPTAPPTKAAQQEILSDTMGVDFGPFLSTVLKEVRSHWYNLIPQEARPPESKRGDVRIEFAVAKNGSVSDVKLGCSSGDADLDRAALNAISAAKLPNLPSTFKGSDLRMRFHFHYNPTAERSSETKH